MQQQSPHLNYPFSLPHTIKFSLAFEMKSFLPNQRIFIRSIGIAHSILLNNPVTIPWKMTSLSEAHTNKQLEVYSLRNFEFELNFYFPTSFPAWKARPSTLC